MRWAPGLRKVAGVTRYPGGTRVTGTADGPPGHGRDVSTVSGFVRTWLRAVRSPWLAAISSVGTAFAVVQVWRTSTGSIDEASMLVSLLLVFGSPTVVATLPHTTVLWRVGAVFVGMHVGPVINSPMEELSFGAFLDSWGTAISDGVGVGYMIVTAAISLPLLEVLGAWIRRGQLAHEASLPRPAWRQ